MFRKYFNIINYELLTTKLFSMVKIGTIMMGSCCITSDRSNSTRVKKWEKCTFFYKLTKYVMSYKMIAVINNLFVDIHAAVWNTKDGLKIWNYTSFKQGYLIDSFLFLVFWNSLENTLEEGIHIAANFTNFIGLLEGTLFQKPTSPKCLIF